MVSKYHCMFLKVFCTSVKVFKAVSISKYCLGCILWWVFLFTLDGDITAHLNRSTLLNERRSHSASLACDVLASHVEPLFLIFFRGYIVCFLAWIPDSYVWKTNMTSSCRRPEHSAPPEVVSDWLYWKWRLLVNAEASAICFGGVKGSLKTFACFYSPFNLIYSQHSPLKWQYYFRLFYFINVAILWSHT